MSTTKTTKAQAVAATEEVTALATVSQVALPATLTDQYKDIVAAAQAEARTMNRDDFTMPFIALTQALTKQRQRGEASYIPGLEEGDFFNTVTNQVFKSGLVVVPVKYEFVYNVWRPRDLGSGFLGSYKTQQEAIDVAVQQIMETTNQASDKTSAREIALRRDKTGWVKDTANQYVLVLDPETGTYEAALLSMTSSKLTPGRKWNTTIQMQLAKPVQGRAAVRWDRSWKIDSVQMKKGENIYFTLKPPTIVGFTEPEVWEQAAQFYNLLRAGAVKIDYTKSGEQDAEEVVVTEEPGEKPAF